jgi:hypothetical protein
MSSAFCSMEVRILPVVRYVSVQIRIIGTGATSVGKVIVCVQCNNSCSRRASGPGLVTVASCLSVNK